MICQILILRGDMLGTAATTALLNVDPFKATQTTTGALVGHSSCCHLRMVPGMIALAACTTAAAYAILRNHTHLVTLFSCGGVSSGYFIYLGWDFQNLKSFADNNNRLATSVGNFEKENAELKNRVHLLGQHNNRLAQSIQDLDAKNKEMEQKLGDFAIENKKFESENLKLVQARDDLEKNIQKLEELKSKWEIETEKNIEWLGGFKNSLDGLKKVAAEDHTLFSEQLKNFENQVNLLLETRTSTQKSSVQFEDKLNTHTQVLLETTGSLKAIFEQVNTWKHAQEWEELLDKQQKHNKLILEQTQLIGANEGRIKELSENVYKLEALKNGFSDQLEKLKNEVGRLKQHNETNLLIV